MNPHLNRGGIRRGPGAPLLALGALLGCIGHGTALASVPDWVRNVRADLGAVDTTGVDAVVLLDRTEYTVDDRLRISRRERRILRILRPAGTDMAKFFFAIEPGSRLGSAQAWTIKGDRTIESRPGDVVESTLSSSGYSDVRRLTVRAPAAEAGDIVAVDFSAEEQHPFGSLTWFPQYAAVPVLHAELQIRLPVGWELEARVHGFTSRPWSRENRQWTLVAGPIEAIPSEQSSPPWRSIYPSAHIRVGPAPGKFQFREWGDVARWYHDLVAPHADRAQAPAELVARTPVGDPPAALIVAAREVQHRVGYTAIELGWKRWEPDDAAATWTLRYGDCKDKATLLIATLAARGLEARPVLCLTRSAGEVDPEWPDAGYFNHCIVAIAGSSRTLGLSVADSGGVEVRGPSGRVWCLFDPTDPTTPLGQISSGLSETYAVIGDPAEGLVRIPRATDGRIMFDFQGRLDDKGTLSGTVRLQAGGNAAGWFAHGLATADSSTRKDWLARSWSSSGPRAELHDIRWIGTDSTRWTSTVEAIVRIPGAARQAGRRWIFTPPFPFAQVDPPATDSTRSLAYWRNWSPEVEVRMSVELPPGMESEPWSEISKSSDLGRYERHLMAIPGRLEIARLYAPRTPVVPAARWPDLRALLQTAYDGDRVPIILH